MAGTGVCERTLLQKKECRVSEGMMRGNWQRLIHLHKHDDDDDGGGDGNDIVRMCEYALANRKNTRKTCSSVIFRPWCDRDLNESNEWTNKPRQSSIHDHFFFFCLFVCVWFFSLHLFIRSFFLSCIRSIDRIDRFLLFSAHSHPRVHLFHANAQPILHTSYFIMNNNNNNMNLQVPANTLHKLYFLILTP